MEAWLSALTVVAFLIAALWIRQHRQMKKDFHSLVGMIDYLYESKQPPDAVDCEIVDALVERYDLYYGHRHVAREVQRSDAMFFNLLAVIHRDGGHHRMEHGLERAALDAEAVVLHERAELDRAAELLDQARHMYHEGGFVGDNVDRWMNNVLLAWNLIQAVRRR